MASAVFADLTRSPQGTNRVSWPVRKESENDVGSLEQLLLYADGHYVAGKLPLGDHLGKILHGVEEYHEGVEALHRSAKGKYSKKAVKHWLSQKDAYTLHKPVRHKFQRNRVFVSDIDRQFQEDLVDMQSLAEFNKGLKDLQGEEIKSTYYIYEAELQKVVDFGFYPVENVIKQRKRRGITEYFVKSLGYPEKFNDWVTDIQKV
ncbi:15-hydroxyprostaglandin dehydrogenase [Trichonephila clavipes]|nr:15-hydroxyprostaglandin dehydrogenase [Trichonephila clavipes]